MKKISLVINIVMGIAIIVLYVLHFTSSGKVTTEKSEVTGLGSIKTEISSIAFVDFDTLLFKYNFYYDQQDDLEEKRQTSEAELNSRSRAYEKEATDFQEKVQKGLVTRSTAQQLEQQLLQEQQNLLQLRDNLSRELMEEEQVMNRQIVNNIMEYLKEYNKQHNYQYVISYRFGGPLLFAQENLDITREVAEGLNEKYNREKKK